MAALDGESLSFRDKKKFFEKEIEDHVTGKKTTPERKFSYLQEHEVTKMKTEEERKMNSMSHAELSDYYTPTDTEGPDYGGIIISSIAPSSPAPASNIRTAKSERRLQDRLSITSASPPTSPSRVSAQIKKVSPAEDRLIEAEKRAAWRKARMDSLVQDAMKAQAVINKSQELDNINQSLSVSDSQNRSGLIIGNTSISVIDSTNGHN